MTAVSDRLPQRSPQEEARKGALYALLAYGLWGTYALYFGALAHFDALEVVAHRAFWSLPVAGAVLIALGRMADLWDIFADWRLMAKMLLTSFLVGVSWGFFVWAVAVDRTLETSLGYYINPLLNVLIGFAVLGERLSRAQTFAVGLAALAVLLQTLTAGVFPWVALVLAASFASYGYLRKTMPVGAVEGFFIEALVLSTVGLLVVAWLSEHGQLRFGTNLSDTLLLIGCGPVTALPLMWFAAAARRIRFATLGLLQYIAPSGLFLTAVFVFGEPLNVWGLASFALIWAALAIYSLDMLRGETEAARRLPSTASATAAARDGRESAS